MGKRKAAKANFWKPLAFWAFIAGAFWASYQLYFIHSTQVSHIFSHRAQPGGLAHLSNEYSPLHLQPPVERWAKDQAVLTQRMSRSLASMVPMEYVYYIFPPKLLDVSAFENYSVAPRKPVAGAVFHLVGGPKCVEFGWTEIPVPAVQYTVEIAKTRDFRFSRSFATAHNRVKLQLEKGADYFWRIRASYGKQTLVGSVSTFLALDPPLPKEEKYVRDLAQRINDPKAWLADVSFCRKQ